MPQIGEKDYYDGAIERIDESSRLLLQGDLLAGSVYLAGRAVECMFRALIWRSDFRYRSGRKTLQTGHDLRELLSEVTNLGLLSDRDDDVFGLVDMVASRWSNNMRFVPHRWVESYWRSSGVVTRKHTMKRASREFFDACVLIIQRCEKLYGKTDKK
jgi:hypothetical protein